MRPRLAVAISLTCGRTMYDDELLREYEAPRMLSPSSRSRRRRIVVAVVLGCLVLVGVGHWTQKALSSDTSAIADNGFITGTVNVTAHEPNAVVNVSRMAPGDSVFRLLKVVNSGSLQYRYAVVASTSDPDGRHLDTQLQFGVFVVPVAGQCSASGVATLTPLGPVRPVTAEGVKTQPLFGDIAPGQQPGDQVMPAVDTELLCIDAHLPDSTGNGFGGATTALHLRFAAEQTAGNS